MPKNSLLTAPAHFWRKELAERVAFLIDAQAYYATLAECLAQAQYSILILGWDVSSRVDLIPGHPDAWPNQLGPRLYQLVTERPLLDVRVLGWNFPLIYAPDREPIPRLNSGWKTHERLHLVLDDQHPIGACHHQKVVVIDDTIAFCGGLDVCIRRWDTSEHRANDARRRDPNGHTYAPFHDIQMMVEGPVAAALGDLARERWRRATGESLRSPPKRQVSAWPASLAPALTQIPVAVSLTNPVFREFPEKRQVEALTLAALKSAREFIYIENQYLTASAVGDFIEASLHEGSGPEIILVLPQRAASWLEEFTMGVLQHRMVARLRRADRFGRLGRLLSGGKKFRPRAHHRARQASNCGRHLCENRLGQFKQPLDGPGYRVRFVTFRRRRPRRGASHRSLARPTFG